MKKLIKWTGISLGVLVAAMLVFLIHIVWFRPYSISIFYDRAFMELALEYPELLSSMRLLEQFGIEAHNDDLDDISPAHDRKINEMYARSLEVLRSYDREGLTGQAAMSYDILETYLQTVTDGFPFTWHDYPVNQQFGVQNDFPQFMTRTHFIGDEGDAEDYIARLSKLDVKFRGLLEGLRLRAERDIVPPRFVIDHVLRDMREFVSQPARENILFTSLGERLAAIDGINEARRQDLLIAAEREIVNSVYPAYSELIAHFEQLQTTVTTNHGVWKLPDGDAYYAYELRRNTTTDMTPDEAHSMGLAEVARIENEMDVILRNQGYTEGSVGERLAALGEEERFLYANTDEGRDQLMADYASIVAEIEAGMDELFGNVPVAGLTLVNVPEMQELTAPIAFYQGPSTDGARPGQFYINLHDTREHPRFIMRTVVFHEAIPGHHVERSISTELEGVAQFRRIVRFTAFMEGWGLYAERLAWETGYQDDPFNNLGRLQWELVRAVRLVVDTGIHAKRWSREQSIAYMLDKTGLIESNVVSEIERYFVVPGQATAYTVGMQKILELRRRACAELGDRFDLAKFHDAVLENGPIPVSLLERQIDRYIAANRAEANQVTLKACSAEDSPHRQREGKGVRPEV